MVLLTHTRPYRSEAPMDTGPTYDTDWLMRAAQEIEEASDHLARLEALDTLEALVQLHRDRALVGAIEEASASRVADVLDVTRQAIYQQHQTARRRLADRTPVTHNACGTRHYPEDPCPAEA